MSSTFRISNGDVVINGSSGQPDLIKDGPKLRQDIRIALGTGARRDNVGAGLDQVIGRSAVTVAAVRSRIRDRIARSIANMRSLQTRYNRAERPRQERIVDFRDLRVQTVADDPTSFYFSIRVISADNRTTAFGATVS